MKLKILYDNEAEESFKASLGFSCLVGDKLLFKNRHSHYN